MNKMLLFTIALALFYMSQVTIKSQDVFIDNIYTPNEHCQPTPYCIVYNEINDLLYVYTGQKIILVNKTTGTIAGSINVGQTGYFSFLSSTPSIEQNHKLAFDHSRNYIYCANNDNEFLVIDCDNNEIIHQLSPNPSVLLINSFIFYNSELDVIYWAQTPVNSQAGPKLVAYNPDNMQIIGNFQGFINQIINDFAFCRQNDYLVIGTNHRVSDHGRINLLHPRTLATYDAYNVNGKLTGKLLYINEVHRLYCLVSGSGQSDLAAFTINDFLNIITRSQAYSISNFPIYSSVSACYNHNNDLAYFTGPGIQGSDYMIILDYTIPSQGSPVLEEYELWDVNQVIFLSSENLVFCAGSSLTKINGTQIEGSTLVNGVANHLIESGNEIIISNFLGGSIQSYSLTPDLLQHTQLGQELMKGVLNTLRQKIYWIGDLFDNPYGIITIQSLVDQSLTAIEIGPGIKDIDWNSYSDKIVISNFSQPESQLTVIDCYTDNKQSFQSGQVEVVRSGIGNNVYLGGWKILNYIDLSDNTIYQVSNNPLSTPFRIKEFVMLGNNTCVALALESHQPGICKLLKIDNNNQVIQVQSFEITPVDRHSLVYSSVKNQIYIISEYGIAVINADNFEWIHNIFPGGRVNRCHYSSRNDRLVIHGFYQGHYRLWFYNASTSEYINTITFEPNEAIISSIYNPMNDMITIHSFNYQWNYNYEVDNEIRLQSFNCSNFQKISDIYLRQNGIKDFLVYDTKEKMVLSANGDSLFIPNQRLGNISIVKCAQDGITLNPDWNWISFPRLERIGNDPVNAREQLENITHCPTYIEMNHRDPETQEYSSITYSLQTGWSGGLEEVKSTLGYKLKTNYGGVSFLPMSGTVLPPETTFPLFGMKYNWTGYFLPQTQSPFDAIGEEFLDKISSMNGRYWYCFKENDPGLKNSGYRWRCACSQGNIEIKYGEMMIIYPSENIADFHWQIGGYRSPEEPRYPSSFFAFHEQAEYDAIFIELDTLEIPAEIGAFAGDSCIGATTVLPSDTMALICAYTEGFEGQEITFGLWYPTKSSRPVRDDYLVLNPQTGIREKRRITAGEQQPYFVVSFSQAPEHNQLPESAWLQCRPNPANRQVTVTYFIGSDMKVDFQLVSALGKVVMSWQPELQNAGKYEYQFSTASLPAGLYQLVMKTGDTQKVEKIMIIHE